MKALPTIPLLCLALSANATVWATLFRPSAGHGQPGPQGPQGPMGPKGDKGDPAQGEDLRTLITDVASLRQRIAELPPQGSAETEAPVGSIVAWPGNLPFNGNPWWNSWRVCDGGASDAERGLPPVSYREHKELWAVLRGSYRNSEAENLGDNGSIILPDFRGCFLRGGGGASNPIGQQQAWATAMPRKVFQTAEAGEHNHDFQKSLNQTGLGGLGFAISGNPTERQQTGAAGIHSHVILGGDEETRPTNFAVHWVIRIK